MSTGDTSETKKVPRSALSRLRQERERRIWTQSEIAERLGTTQINVSRWENGITAPGPYYRQKLVELFGKSSEELDLLPKSSKEPTAEAPSSLNVPEPRTLASPPTWSIAYRRNPFFTGRKEVLTDLHTALKDNKTVTLPLAISGLGGIGKTQIAVEYAYRYSNDYQTIFWINATSHDSFSADFVALATLLDLPERHEQDQGTVIRAVKRWLTTHTGWLLIMDNVDNLEMIVDVLPTYGTGEVLLTTRLQALGTIAQSIEVENMSLDEGIKFLLCRIKAMLPGAPSEQAMEENKAQAAKIVDMLDGLPLALDQAGAYIEETRCGLSQYLNLYATHRKELLLRRGSFPIDHPTSVAATWSISFQQVERENPAAADLLRLLTFLDSEAIPEEIITLGAKELGPFLKTVANDPLQVDAIIELLLHYSLIRRTSDVRCLSIHRLVQAVIKDGMEKNTQRVWAERTIRAVNSTFPYVDPQTRQSQTLEKYQRYLPHVQTCALSSKEYALAFPEAAQLFNEAASYLIVYTRYEQAEFLLLRAWEIRQHVLRTHHPDIAHTLNNLGELYLNWGKYREAEAWLQKALDMRQQELGEEHPDVAQTRYNLASLYRSQGAYEKAEPFYLQALHLREITLADHHHPLIAQSLYGLARLYLSQEKYSQAEEFCQKALLIREQYVKENPRGLASTLSVLARIYRKQEKLDKAIETNKRALNTREDISGKNHPHIAIILNSMAEIYHDQGRYHEANPLIARGFKIFEEALGPEHPYMAYSFSNLAENSFLQGIYDQAEAYYKKALGIRKKHLGSNHPHTASTYCNLAKLYSDRERYEEAEKLYHQAFSIQKNIFGRNHPTVISTREQYMMVLRKLNREREADELATNNI